jgi:hypothetical protein
MSCMIPWGGTSIGLMNAARVFPLMQPSGSARRVEEFTRLDQFLQIREERRTSDSAVVFYTVPTRMIAFSTEPRPWYW